MSLHHDLLKDNDAGSAFNVRLLAHFVTIIFLFTTQTVNCFLHFGQYNGKFNNTVLSDTLTRVLLWHLGHKIHFV